ncbi:3-oxoacyl-ACP synthase, partial [Streptomyces sp. DSM 41635]|nr:3-oxoacyl-ACP synthase [Streptomyces sp. DSM 41635]
LPPHVVDNDAVIARGALLTDAGWIRARTGIERRRHASPGTSTGDLAVGAGRAALASAGRARPDLVLLATSTPDHPCPATAPEVAHRLGLGTVGAFDVSAVCSGFLYALAVAAGATVAVLNLPAASNHLVLSLLVAVALGTAALWALAVRNRPGVPDSFVQRWLDAARSPVGFVLLVVYL